MSGKERPEVDRIIDVAAQEAAPTTETVERRARERHPYDAMVGLILLDDDDRPSGPRVLRAKDLSEGGLCLTSRTALPVGCRGAVQLVRSDGRMALTGVEVRHCRYVEDQAHEIGFMFIPLPQGVTRDQFTDANGRMTPVDPLLHDNIDT